MSLASKSLKASVSLPCGIRCSVQVCDLLMEEEEVFTPYHVFINHRGPDVKRTLASLIYHRLQGHGLRVFLDKQELQVGDSLTPAIKSAICSASVQIAIFSKTYAQSAWCLNELLWMFDCHSSKIIPIFYDIQPSDLRHVDQGEYAGAFQEHRDKGRVTTQQIDSWISALKKASDKSGVVISTEKDDLGELLEEIVEVVLKKVKREELDVGMYSVGLRQAAEDFERWLLNQSEISGVKVVGIVGLGGSGKSTLVTHLFNSQRSQFHRSCFLSQVNKRDLPSLHRTLYRDLLGDHMLYFEDTLRGRSVLRDRLRWLRRVLIVFDDIDNTEQIDNLLFVKDVVGNGSMILVTSRDQSLLVSCNIKIYNVKLLKAKDAQELFCWHAFGHAETADDLKDTVDEIVGMCSGFPLALKVLAGLLNNERDPRKWKQQLKSLRKELPNNLLEQTVKNSYESLDIREKEAFLDIAHFFIGEDAGLVERVFDGLNGSGSQCLQMLHHKCLVEFESADIFPPIISHISQDRSWFQRPSRIGVGSKIRMHDLVKDLAIQIGRKETTLRLCCRNDTMIPPPASHVLGDKFDVRGIRNDDAMLENSVPPVTCRRNDEDPLLFFLQNENIWGLKLMALEHSTLPRRFNSLSGDLIWFRLRQSEDSLTTPFSQIFLSNLIPSTLLVKNLSVLELHGVNLEDFGNFFDKREPPSQLRELTLTVKHCPRDYQMSSTLMAGPSKAESPSKTSDSLQPQISFDPYVSVSNSLRRSAIVLWFGRWLERLNLKNLGKIVLQNIASLRTLPIKFEEVRNLKHVDLSDCSDLEILPDSFTQELLQLQYLALRGCRKLIFRTLGKISTLEYLDCDGCSKLNELPRGTEAQKSLKYLNVLRTALTELPQNLQQLQNLEQLLIESPHLRELPSSLYTLNSLTDLTLSGCRNLHFIDNSIEKLVHLERFRIFYCGVKGLPERIAWMNLKILDVQGCPLGSKHLMIRVDSENMPPGSSQVSIDHGSHHNQSSCLTDLITRHSHIIGIHIPRAESLFPNLEIIDLSDNFYLRDIGSLPGSLVTLNLKNCSELRTLSCLSNLGRLKVLDISGCVALETLNVEGLNSIEVIKADKCCKIQSIQGLEQLQKLSYFQISVHSLTRSSSTDIMTCAPNISTAVLSGSAMEKGVVDGIDRVASRFEGVKVRRILHRSELEGYVEPKSAIFLYLRTDHNSDIAVTFFGHVYHSCSSGFNYRVHILMWTADSEAYKFVKSSSDKAQGLSLLRGEFQDGWIGEAEDSEVCKQFITYLFLEGYI